VLGPIAGLDLDNGVWTSAARRVQVQVALDLTRFFDLGKKNV